MAETLDEDEMIAECEDELGSIAEEEEETVAVQEHLPSVYTVTDLVGSNEEVSFEDECVSVSTNFNLDTNAIANDVDRKTESFPITVETKTAVETSRMVESNPVPNEAEDNSISNNSDNISVARYLASIVNDS